MFSKPKLSSSKGSRASTVAGGASSQLSQTTQQVSKSGKPPLKPSDSKSSFIVESTTDQLANEVSAGNSEQQAGEDAVMSATEEIESRYSDGNEDSGKEEAKEAKR